MSAPAPQTYRDLIEALVYHLGGAANERNQAQVRTAIRNAYRDITNGRSWLYYWAKGRIEFNIPYTTGTIQYDNASKTVTLTGGTFPSNVDHYWSIQINRVISRVKSLASSTSLILDDVNNPQQDIAAGNAYTLFQDIYALPSDFKAMTAPRGESNWWISNFVSPEDWMFSERAFGGTTNSGMPTAWTIMGDPNVLAGHAIFVWPWPGVAKTYDFMYQRYPRALTRTGYATADSVGTVTGTAGTSTLSGSGTAFTSAMVGSVIRLGTNVASQAVPTGLDGINAYQEQFTISAVASATSLTIDGTLANAYTANRYVISDPVDMPDKMLTALIRRVESEIADLKDRGAVERAMERARMALLAAGEADHVMLSPQFVDDFPGTNRPPLRYHPYTLPSLG